MQKGNIGVTTENIFPVIKKFLYSDHEIFLRELVSNAVDATQKLRTLATAGETSVDDKELKVSVSVDEQAGTLTVTDNGIGMTADEIERYINQIAFSGVSDFMEKYKDKAEAIIGHFGLGFYSAFMVAKRVDILTKSYRPDSQAVKWSCDGSPEYTLEDIDKTERGTSIVLHIDDDSKDFLKKERIEQLLNKYCKFMPVPVIFGKKTTWKDGKQVETDEDNVVNSTEPLWTKAPTTLKDEDYKSFYRTLFPMNDEPLFWIHLNVDFPFHLTGILYFPPIKNNIDLQRNKIQLYSNQVYVTDKVDGIVPEFLTLLHGVIDSPDIPLNVSRSYLQADANVKKISGYITRKVADRLNSLFKENRKEYESKWADLKIFVNYGNLSDNDFYEKAKDFTLLTDVDHKNFTLDEYRTLIKENQTDKEDTLVYLYATDTEAQYSYIQAARDKGYSVLLADGELDLPMISMLEQKLEKSRFVRVDSNTADKLILKDNSSQQELPTEKQELINEAFQTQLPQIDRVQINVVSQPMGSTARPAQITTDEYMRRMKEMSRYQQGMNFYAQLPDSYNLVLNTDHPLIQAILKTTETGTADSLKPVTAEIKGIQAKLDALRQERNKKKPEDVTQNEKDEIQNAEKALAGEQEKRRGIISESSKQNPAIHQIIDLALLQNGMLKGAALDAFVKRSVDMIK